MADSQTSRLDLLDMPIRVWVPLTPGDVFLAKIGDGPVLFQGKSSEAVTAKADEWRKEERAKFLARSATAADRDRIAANREKADD